MGNGKDAELEASLILKQNINYLETPQMLVLKPILLGSKVPLAFCEKNAKILFTGMLCQTQTVVMICHCCLPTRPRPCSDTGCFPW